MWPTTLTGFASLILTLATLLGGFLKWTKWYHDTDLEKAKSRDAVEIAKYNAEIAKQQAEILTASQVAELLKSTHELKGEVAQIKIDYKDKNEQITKVMDRLEDNFRDWQKLLQQFLQTRVTQLEQILIK